MFFTLYFNKQDEGDLTKKTIKSHIVTLPLVFKNITFQPVDI